MRIRVVWIRAHTASEVILAQLWTLALDQRTLHARALQPPRPRFPKPLRNALHAPGLAQSEKSIAQCLNTLPIISLKSESERLPNMSACLMASMTAVMTLSNFSPKYFSLSS